MLQIRLVMFCAAFRAARALLHARPPLPARRCAARAYAAKGADDLASLEKELARHDNLYYNQAKPELTDEAYDALARKVDKLRTTPRGVVLNLSTFRASASYASSVSSGFAWL